MHTIHVCSTWSVLRHVKTPIASVYERIRSTFIHCSHEGFGMQRGYCKRFVLNQACKYVRMTKTIGEIPCVYKVLLSAVVDPNPNDDFPRCCKLVSKRTVWCIENSNNWSFILDESYLFQTCLSSLTAFRAFRRNHMGLSQPSLVPLEDASDSSQEDSDESSASAVQVPRDVRGISCDQE